MLLEGNVPQVCMCVCVRGGGGGRGRERERGPECAVPGVVMSWMLDLRLSFLLRELRRMKYFWAWLATYAGASFSAGESLCRVRGKVCAAQAILLCPYFNVLPV